MDKAIMMVVGLFMVISWARWHLQPVGRHVKNDGVPAFIHVMWLFGGLVLVSAVYVMLAVS